MKESRDTLNAAFLNLPVKPFFAAKKTDPAELRGLLNALKPVLPVKPLIRLGPDGDGGYLVPDDLEGITTCFSPGVSMVSGFELDCAKRGMDVFMADASVDGPADNHPRFHFLKNFVGAYSHDEFITMEDWVAKVQADQNGDWLFQIDIEGAEYEFLLSLPERFLKKFRVVVIEFHLLDHLFCQEFFRLANCAFRKILQHHTCVHIHPNNAGAAVSSGDFTFPKILEFTFYRKDRGISETPANVFPHLLDFTSVKCFPEITLPSCWHG